MALSASLRIAIAVLIAAQLALVIVSLIDLARRPAVLGGRKWIWLLVILLGNMLGPILYLALGRKAAPAAEPDSRQAPSPDRAQRAADVLYGKKDAR